VWTCQVPVIVSASFWGESDTGFDLPIQTCFSLKQGKVVTWNRNIHGCVTSQQPCPYFSVWPRVLPTQVGLRPADRTGSPSPSPARLPAGFGTHLGYPDVPSSGSAAGLSPAWDGGPGQHRAGGLCFSLLSVRSAPPAWRGA